MIVGRSDLAMIAIAGLCAVAIPAWLLWPPVSESMPSSQSAIVRPKNAPDPAPGERRFFVGESGEPGAALPQDAPDLTGVVGRPPHDAVALVRTAEGTTKTLAPGQSYGGWRLEAVSAEAALFSRGPLQIRVPMPAVDPPDVPDDQ